MASDDFLQTLASRLSSSSKILKDEKSSEFAASMSRWSNYDVKTPFAIVQPANEQDTVITVQEAIRASVPFVPASGGHSPWSTIGQEDVVIDLSKFVGINVDANKCQVTVRGGTLMKELQLALHPYKQFTAVANGNTVGVIPYYLGGGISIYTPFIGYASENVVAAKLVNARGELIEVTEASSPELLWGLRGAGQFFGLVTELTIRTLPYSVLGNDEGQRMTGTYIFLPQKVDAVIAALDTIRESTEFISAGHFMIIQAPPDLKQQVLLVAPQVFATHEQAIRLFQPLVDAGPIQQALVASTFDKHSDHIDWICTKGEQKRFSQMGLQGWSTPNFKRLIELHAELVAGCPDTARSGYTVEWHSKSRAKREFKSSFGHENIDYWLNLLSWYTDPAHGNLVAMMDQKAQVAMRTSSEPGSFVSYTNTTREDPVEYRYKGEERIERLRALKKQVDPAGVFTKEFL